MAIDEKDQSNSTGAQVEIPDEEDVLAFEEELGSSKFEAREFRGPGGLASQQIPPPRTHGNANEKGVPGAFGSEEDPGDVPQGRDQPANEPDR